MREGSRQLRTEQRPKSKESTWRRWTAEALPARPLRKRLILSPLRPSKKKELPTMLSMERVETSYQRRASSESSGVLKFSSDPLVSHCSPGSPSSCMAVALNPPLGHSARVGKRRSGSTFLRTEMVTAPPMYLVSASQAWSRKQAPNATRQQT